MKRRLILTISATAILAGVAVGGYLWYAHDDNTGSAQSTLDLINEKLAAHGEPTLPPGTDPSRASATGPTQPPSATVTPGPSSTPLPPACGEGAISGGQEIVNVYGEVRSCGVYGTQVVFTTVGTVSTSGGVATFQCLADDDACLHKRAPRSSGAWQFFPAPKPGGVKILAFSPPSTLVLNGDQGCFNLATHTYEASTTCQ